MAKSQDAKKTAKKQPAKSLKEKRVESKAKKGTKGAGRGVMSFADAPVRRTPRFPSS